MRLSVVQSLIIKLELSGAGKSFFTEERCNIKTLKQKISMIESTGNLTAEQERYLDDLYFLISGLPDNTEVICS